MEIIINIDLKQRRGRNFLKKLYRLPFIKKIEPKEFSAELLEAIDQAEKGKTKKLTADSDLAVFIAKKMKDE